jgi:Protein-L-isoaspartate(D-aspartate) O-methyltransferase (PCMT)
MCRRATPDGRALTGAESVAASRSESERLRRRLVGELREKGVIRSELVEAAFLSVPRERIVADTTPEGGLDAIYRDEAIATKRNADGMPLSSSSQPALMAEMLELLALRPGDRVLEGRRRHGLQRGADGAHRRLERTRDERRYRSRGCATRSPGAT